MLCESNKSKKNSQGFSIKQHYTTSNLAALVCIVFNMALILHQETVDHRPFCFLDSFLFSYKNIYSNIKATKVILKTTLPKKGQPMRLLQITT